ncbi:hypothetical protein [Enterococcus avium]
MDQRRSKKIVLIYVLISVACFALFITQNFKMYSEIEQDRQATLALLVKEEKFSEAALIKTFKVNKTSDLANEGASLEAKYNLIDKMDHPRLLRTLLIRNLQIFTLCWLLISLLFFWQMKEKIKLQKSLEKETKEYHESSIQNELLL